MSDVQVVGPRPANPRDPFVGTLKSGAYLRVLTGVVGIVTIFVATVGFSGNVTESFANTCVAAIAALVAVDNAARRYQKATEAKSPNFDSSV